jgi:hypothetical protein
VTVLAVVPDLLLASRIEESARRAGVPFRRFNGPESLPPPEGGDLLLVDWSAREPAWGKRLREWCARRTVSPPLRPILFGPHTDLAAHADARAAGLGPMWARSRLVAELPVLLPASGAAPPG